MSVIIATYNRADLVGEAIASVLRQDFGDLELIVVDDGSTDGTDVVLASFDDTRLQIVRRDHAGAAAAWAEGCRRARGHYVAQLGSDDRWLPHCLSRLTSVAATRPEAVLVYARARAMDLDGDLLPQVTGTDEPFPGRTLLSILYGDFVTAITALVSRPALDTTGLPDPSLPAAEDWDLWIRLAAIGPFVFVDEVLAQFRIHKNRSTSPRRAALEIVSASRLRVLEKAYSMPQLPSEVWAARPLVYRNAYVDIGLRWLQAGEPRRAASSFRQALASGAGHAGTLARIAYLAAYYAVVNRFGFAVRLSDAVARRRRLRRGVAHPAPQPTDGKAGGKEPEAAASQHGMSERTE